MEKVTVSKEVAEAIEHAKRTCIVSALIRFADGESGFLHPKMKLLRKELDREALLHAIFYGYEVEQTPEEKLREYYESLDMQSREADEAYGVRETLNILGITIEGINADKTEEDASILF